MVILRPITQLSQLLLSVLILISQGCEQAVSFRLTDSKALLFVPKKALFGENRRQFKAVWQEVTEVQLFHDSHGKLYGLKVWWHSTEAFFSVENGGSLRYDSCRQLETVLRDLSAFAAPVEQLNVDPFAATVLIV